MFDRALLQAQLAADRGEVPVGAVVVKDGRVVGEGGNRCIADNDPSAHAEIVALRQAAVTLGNYRLDGCELYVTLEPCVMCAGAIANARINRLYFAAPDAKMGAVGSVMNVLANPHMNHHTTVIAEANSEAAHESSRLLSDFFKQRRQQKLTQRLLNFPLRDDALRTPDQAFDNCQDYPWPPHYIADLPSLNGLRQHYLDVADAQHNRTDTNTYLLLHGHASWSYVYKDVIPVVLADGHRVVAPDLIGFGRSDKPKAESFHTFEWHTHNLLELVERLDLQRVIVVVPTSHLALGVTLPAAAPWRYKGFWVMNSTLPVESVATGAAYAAPFPNKGYRAATRCFPDLMPCPAGVNATSVMPQDTHILYTHVAAEPTKEVAMQAVKVFS